METPKKIIGFDSKCFICSKTAAKRERVRIFGASEEDIPGLIGYALDKDITVYSNSEVVICLKCYKRLQRLKKAYRNLEDVKRKSRIYRMNLNIK